MYFKLVSEVSEVEIIAVRTAIRDLAALQEAYGGQRWRKLKGIALVELQDGHVHLAEVHWYECHGIGRRRMKIKRFLD